MFTGIIETLGTVASLRRNSAAGSPEQSMRISITVDAPEFLADVSLGDSIAVDGACLTVVRTDKGNFEVETAPVTMERTTLGELASGNKVNLEKAMSASGRFGGHMVSGHVDAIGSIRSRKHQGNAVLIEIEAPEWFNAILIDRGSVAVDGISLTVAYLQQDSFTVSIIPHTGARTTIAEKATGSKVNLEADMIAKYVKRLLEGAGKEKSGLTLDALQRHGFAT